MGGGRVRATCRCSTCSTARRSRSASRRCCATSSRRMRGEAGERFLALPARHPRADPRRGRRRAGATPASRELAAEVRRAAGDYTRADAGVRGAAAATCSARSRGARRRRAVDLGAPPTRCCRCWPRDAGRAAAGGRRHRRRTSAASATGAAASGCPSAPTRPGSSATWPSTACARSASTRPTRSGSARSTTSSRSRTEAGPVAVPIDWETIELVWDDATATRRTAPTATTTAARVHDLKPWNNGGEPYDHDARAGARARARARLRGERARGSTPTGRARPAGLLCCALDTELLGHWWYEGLDWLRGGDRGGARRRASSSRTVSEGARARRAASSGRSRRRPGARRKDLTTWDSPARGRAWPSPRARARAAHRGGRGRPHGAPDAALERAARELLALQSSDWAFMVTRDLAGRLPARARAAARDGRWTPRWPL